MTAPSENPIDVEAADWVARRDRGFSDAEVKALEAWLAADDRHRGAFVRAHAAWLLLDRSRALADAPPVVQRKTLSRRTLAFGGGAIAAGVAAAAVLPRLLGAERFATQIGEARSVPLADGSSVDLNTASRIAVTYGADRRDVALETGEAWFDVAKDRHRPFVVSAGPARVRAVGTAFTVRRLGDDVRVTVTEGVVELWREDAPERAPVRVAAGGQALLTPARAVLSTLAPDTLDGGLAWRTGRVVLRDVPVEEAVAEINRYNERPIEIAPDARGGRIVGVFRARDPEGFARAAAIALDLSMDADAKRIRLHR